MPDHHRPAASLTPSLLARRGDARPAMRRQGIGSLHLPLTDHEDLGWNDIGAEPDASDPPMTSLAAMTPPAPQSHQSDPVEAAAAPSIAPSRSPLERQLEAIAERINDGSRESNVEPTLPPRTRKEPSHLADSALRKAAFTLRLESDRHLRLRLLSAVTHRSAQQLLVEALDALLADHEKVEVLAQQVEVSGDKPAMQAGLTEKA